MRSPTKLKVLANFWPPKNVTAFYSALSGFVQLSSALEIFFLVARQCALPQSCKCLPIFDPKKCYKPLSPPPLLSRFFSARLFSFPQVENRFKRTPLCGCCRHPRRRNWWIKEGAKWGIFGSFSENVRPRKRIYTGSFKKIWTSSTLATEVTGPDTLWFFPMGIR